MKTRAEYLKQLGSDYFIHQKLKSGELFHIDKGIYSEKKYVPELAILSYKYPNAVITMRSAFYLHGLTDVAPEKYDFATERNAAKIADTRIRQVFVPPAIFPYGIVKVDYKGYQISVYNKERMLVELARYKTKLPLDYYKEILLNYRRILPSLNIEEIQDYAMASPKSNKIWSVLQTEVF